MPRFHHANLGVPPSLEQAQGRFLIEVLGYPKMQVPADLEHVARWFEAEDGTQIQLSVDAEHRPASKAHTAIEVDAAGVAYQASERGGIRVVLCEDPAGNRWELRRQI